MMAISSLEKDVASARLHFCFVIIHITFEATLIDEGRLNVSRLQQAVTERTLFDECLKRR
jgi:hypothetical protein